MYTDNQRIISWLCLGGVGRVVAGVGRAVARAEENLRC